MNLPIEELFDILRTSNGKADPWQEIIQLCRQAAPSDFWAIIPNVEVERDVEYLIEEILPACMKDSPKGIYFGLDTLNMQEEDAFNIEIGISHEEECSNADPDVAWVYSDLDILGQFLLPGIKKLNDAYATPQWKDVFSFCDYVLPLAYSGLVLTLALSRINSNAVFAVAWGFHDGDLFLLGTRKASQFSGEYTWR